MSLIEFLTSCADALREMLGTTESIPAAEYPDRIRSIQTGIDTSDADMTAADLRLNKVGYAKDEKVVGTMPELAAQVITPGVADQIITAGQYLAGALTIAGDVNLVSANIVSGKSVFGVVGSAVSSPFQEASVTVKLSTKYSTYGDVYVSYQKADGTWNTAYLSVGGSLTLAAAKGGWLTVHAADPQNARAYIATNAGSGFSVVSPGDYPPTAVINDTSATISVYEA